MNVHKGVTVLYRKELFWMTLLAATIIFFCQRLLFTGQIIRASDVITQFFWAAKGVHEQTVYQYLQSLPGIFQANWEPLNDGGRTLEGGWNAIGLLFHRYMIQHFFPFPSSIAWLAVLSLAWGGLGTFRYCRGIGIGPLGAFLAGLIFALGAENATLINAGHIQKLEAISWFPWILLLLDRAISSKRFFHHAMTALLLAVQFFTMHWQISFYTCLAIGFYWLFQTGWLLTGEPGSRPQWKRDILLALVMVLLFFSTIAMSFAPLFSWSQQSERGSGMSHEEGMSWSMPPEEILTYVVPGLVGFSRQEEGDRPDKGQTYYWGRMHFTQTSDYLGLLPWLLLPLPLIFRRDRFSWFFTLLMSATLIMALGKYTFVYRFLFDHLPGFATFRVPKMILFLFAFGMSVLAGQGLQIIMDEKIDRRMFGKWLLGCSLLAGLMAVGWLFLNNSPETVLNMTRGVINQATRYQSDPSLIDDRYRNMIRETGLAFGLCCLHLVTFLAWYRRLLPTRHLLSCLYLLLLLDLWRVNDRFFVLTTPPQADRKAARNDIVSFLEPRMGLYRMQPLDATSSHYYADYGFPNISAYVTISEKRYREFLEAFSPMSAMPDIMNLRYLVISGTDQTTQEAALAKKYTPVFTSSNGGMVLENRAVLPKAWLVPAAVVVTDPRQRVAILASSPDFDPARVALVESPPPFPLVPYAKGMSSAGNAHVDLYTPNRIRVTAAPVNNCLLVLGEKQYRWWTARINGSPAEIQTVDHILRGVYLPPGKHTVEFVFDPLPFKIGKYLTLSSLALFAIILTRECFRRRGQVSSLD